MKNKTTVSILALFLWGLGVHRFYMWNIWLAVLYLLFSWTFIPMFISIFEFIYFISFSDDKFNEIFNKMKKCSTCAEYVKIEAKACRYCWCELK